MRKSKTRTTHRTSIFDKRSCTVAAAIVIVLGGLAYFRNDLPMLTLSSAGPQIPRDLPHGAILIPDGDGRCRLRAIDTKTGQVWDDGLVDCLDAADQTSAAWQSFGEQQKASQIRKSFRSE
jgi:hypothetical protein